jgi:uncharacterized protein (TIGR02588 family)
VNDKSSQGDDIPLIEWIVGIIGAVFVIGTIMFLVIETLNDAGNPPELLITVGTITPGQDGYHVDLIVRNNSDLSAQAVVIEGTLTRDGESVETSQVTFDYVAAQSETPGGLFFTENPAQLELEVRPLGYQLP